MSKLDQAVEMLNRGWTPIADLAAAADWKEHTARARLSNLATKRGLKIERQRVDGVTSYRIAPALDFDPIQDVRASEAYCREAVRESMANGGKGREPKE